MTTLPRQIDSRRILLYSATATAVVAAWLWLLSGPFYRRHPSLAEIGAAFDLLVVLPFVYWLLAGRRLSAIRGEMTIVCLVSLALSLLIIPGAVGAAWSMIWTLELVLIGAAVIRLRASIKRAPAEQPIERRIREISRDLVPFRPAAEVLASELSLIAFAFSGGKLLDREMTPHRWRESQGWFGVVIGLCLAVVAESIAVHLLLMERMPVLVWVILALDLYGLVWLIGDARALARTGIRVEDSSLAFQFGLRWRARVEISEIDSVAPFTDEADLDLSLALIESPDLILSFRDDVVFTALYGIRRKVRTVGIRVENARDLVEALEELSGRPLRQVPDPSVAVEPAETPAKAKTPARMTRQSWLRTRPDYIPLEDWMKSKPPWVD